MSGEAMVLRMLAESAAGVFLTGVGRLAEAHPHPHGPQLRVTVTVVDGGDQVGHVDVDVTNLWDLGMFADRRAAASFGPVPRAPRLRLLRGEKDATAEHEKTKDPLPSRPRGPHPYPMGVA